MANIEIRLFASLVSKTPTEALSYRIEPGISVAGLLEQLQVSPQDAKLIFINGQRSNLDTKLQGGERVGIFPPVGGG